MNPIALLLRLNGLRRRPRPVFALAAPPARTPLESLLMDDFYLAERAVIQPRGDAPRRAGRLSSL